MATRKEHEASAHKALAEAEEYEAEARKAPEKGGVLPYIEGRIQGKGFLGPEQGPQGVRKGQAGFEVGRRAHPSVCRGLMPASGALVPTFPSSPPPAALPVGALRASLFPAACGDGTASSLPIPPDRRRSR